MTWRSHAVGAVASGAIVPLAELAVEHPRSARLDRFCRLALSAAQAVVTAPRLERPGFGIFLGTELGCFGANTDHQARVAHHGVRGVSPLGFPSTVPSAAAAEIAIALGAMGPNVTLTGGPEVARAVWRQGLWALREGEVQQALIGVADAWHDGLSALGLSPLDYDGAVMLFVPEPPSPAELARALASLEGGAEGSALRRAQRFAERLRVSDCGS